MERGEHEAALDRPRSAIFLIAAVALLYLAREVLVPVALAILLTFVITPLVARIERAVRNRGLAVLLATLLVIGMLGGGILFAGHQFAGLADELPTYRATIVRKVRALQEGPGGLVGRALGALRRMGDEIARAPIPSPTAQGPPPQAPQTAPAPASTAQSPVAVPPAGPPTSGWALLTPILQPLASGAIVVLLLIMMLMARENIRDRIIRLAGLNQIGFTTQTLEEAGTRVGKYLRAQLLINTMFALSVGTGLLILEIPNAALCGLLAGVLRFIPILGPWLGAGIPAALALAVFDDWYHVAIVVALFAGLEALTNIVLEPWLYGASTGLSSFGIILAIVFWTWVWGPVGLVLAVPMTVCVIVFTRHIPHLSGLSILLSDEPVLSTSVRYYQRLLCRDEEEAAAILAAAPADADPIDVLDEVVVPSLSAARADLQRELITSAQASRIGAGALELALEWLAERDADRPAPTPSRPAGDVACLPAQDALDEAAAAVLAHLLQREGIAARTISAQLLISERIAAAEAPGLGLIVVCSVGPRGDMQTRRIRKTLERRLPGTPVVVAAWGGQAAPDPAQPAPDAPNQASTNRQAITLVKALLAVQPSPEAGATPA